MFQRILHFIYFWKYNVRPEHIESQSKKLVLYGAKQAFILFKDEKFRQLVKFTEIGEEEQNRIFNELMVTNLMFLMFLLEQILKEANDEKRKLYYKSLRETVPEYFKKYLRTIGIQEEYASIWDALIDLRYDEYSKDIIDVRSEFLKGDNELSELGKQNIAMIYQSLALGLYRHIVRGKIVQDDPLYKYLQLYLLIVHRGYLKNI